jgi:malate dehydrogenase (oxaloacetate-decarboxylating)
VAKSTTPCYRVAITCKYKNEPGRLAALTQALAKAGGSLGEIKTIQLNRGFITREIQVDCSSLEQEKDVVAAVRSTEGIELLSACDSTFAMHLGGKIEIKSKSPLETRDDLSMAYTPGVARVCNAIAADPIRSFGLTIRRNMVAVVSDGSAVLGLGNIGALGAMPVMEGKAILFKEFGGVDAFPICLDTQDTEEIIKAVKQLAPTFGGINLEDISAPRCFEIEDRLRRELDIPVFHDDQHGTAAVVLAALINAVKIVGKNLKDMKAVVSGAGAAGVACTKALLALGMGDVIVCDTKGAIYKGRSAGMNPAKEWLAENTNKERLEGSLLQALAGADMILGVSGPGLLKGRDLTVMAKDPIVFALSNPVPEIMPEEAAPYVRVMATGRSDYPNQINNVLCFPGLFRGLLDCSSKKVTEEMVVAAARAIASNVREDELCEDFIIPSVFNRDVAPSVASAVRSIAEKSGLARVIPSDLCNPETLNV